MTKYRARYPTTNCPLNNPKSEKEYFSRLGRIAKIWRVLCSWIKSENEQPSNRYVVGYSCARRVTEAVLESLKSAEGRTCDRFVSVFVWSGHMYTAYIGTRNVDEYRARYEPCMLVSSLFRWLGSTGLCIWVSASNNKRVEHCWKMGRTRRHLPMYRTYTETRACVCACSCMDARDAEQTACIMLLPRHPRAVRSVTRAEANECFQESAQFRTWREQVANTVSYVCTPSPINHETLGTLTTDINFSI